MVAGTVKRKRKNWLKKLEDDFKRHGQPSILRYISKLIEWAKK